MLKSFVTGHCPMKSAPHILIVEDDRAFGAMLEDAVRGDGYEATRVTRAEDALRCIRRQALNAVITDLKLPGLSGLELIEKIREINPSLPVISMTAFGTTNAAIQSAKLGAFDYLIKPFELTTFLEMLKKAVSNQGCAEVRSGMLRV
jgi:DNA-binding NtrC family response regulator